MSAGTTPSFENLLVEDAGHIRTITFNRPKAMNALNTKTIDELERAVRAAAVADLRGLILTGAGEKAFVAGADIAEMKDMTAAQAEFFSKRGHDVFAALGALPFPVVAAVNGFALGGGLEVALACDFIYAADSAKLGLVETSLGLIPGFGGTVRLPRRVGAAMAAELIVSAAVLKADEALRVGLVNKVFPAAELLAEAKKVLATIAEKGPAAVALTKQLLSADDKAAFEAASKREQQAFGKAFETADHTEGVSAFLEKRKPTFTGK